MLPYSVRKNPHSFVALALLLLGAGASAQTVRIDCGSGSAYTATDGTVWQADTNFTGGQQLYTSYNVSGTTDGLLYRSSRQGYYGDFTYNIPLTNGNYQLTLKFAEIQFSNPGQRIFNVTVNGTAVLQNFDIVAQAGYWNAIDKQFPVTVTNGSMQITAHGAVNYGLISAIQIVPESSPVTQVSPTGVTFNAVAGGSNPSSQPVSITNGGGGTLSWNATKGQPWLTLGSSSGTAPSSLSLSASIAGISAGTYTDTVAINGGSGGTQNVSVTLNVAAPPPILSVSPPSFSFAGSAGGADPASQNLAISNAGGGTLSWTASKAQPWLTLSQTSGAGAATVTVGALMGAMSAGTYTDTITVSASGATGSPQSIGVSLVISAGPPVLSIGPSGLNYTATAGGSNPTSQNISISNTGGGTLTWTAAKTQTWLTLSSGSGTAPSVIAASILLTGLSAGTYTDTVTITPSVGSAKTVGVTLVVSNPPPSLGVNPTSATFSAVVSASNPVSQNIAISNTGGGTLTWTASNSKPWLTLSAGSGTAPSSLGLNVSITGLGAGTYTDTVAITGAGSTTNVGVTLTVTAGNITNSATFVKLDPNTLGSWKNVYGADGYDIQAVTSSLPAYAQIGVSGAAMYTWSGSSSDPRALQAPSGSTRLAATWYQAPTFSLDVNFTDGITHQLALYALDWDSEGRVQRVDILDAGTGTVLDTRSMSGFASGEYAVWNISGHVTVKLTQLAGTNAVVSALFFDPAGQAPTGGTGAFVTLDSLTKGNWINVYGQDGYDIQAASQNSLPSYATVTPTGSSTFTWAGNPSDARALQQPGGASRIAATWYSSSPFSFDVNLTGGATHRIAMYALDWDSSGRSERVDVMDATTSVVLDSHTLSNFAGGQYLVWNLQGHVIIKITPLSGPNGVLSGLFFSGGPQLSPAVLSVSSNSVSLTGVAYSANSTSQSVSISNTGGGTLLWSASGTQPWLSLPAASGAAPSNLVVQAQTTLLGAGTYTDTVTVGSSGTTGSPQLISVTLTLAAPPVLGLSTTSLSFNGISGAANPAPQTLTISNTGAGTLAWTASKTQNWLTLSSASGTSNTPVSVSVASSGLAAGTYSDTITVSATGALSSPQTVAVSLVVTSPTPALNLSMTSAAYSAVAGGANPASQTVSISNTGGGTLNWTASNTHSWLTLSAASGTAPASLGLNVSTSGLSAGTYTDTVTIAAAGASNAPQTVAVTMTITPAAGNSVSFIKLDTTTQGNWHNVYGNSGYNLIQSPPSIPSWVQLSVNGPFIFTWAGGTSDARALQVPGGNNRLAATWYASGTFNFDVNITDGQTHQVSFYAVDYDGSGRAERFDLIDTGTGVVLDTRTLTNFAAGQYPVWNISGHVMVQITQLLGPNAVVSGVFFDPAGAAPVGTTLFERLDNSTLGNWPNAYGGDGFSFVGATPSLPTYAQVTVSPAATTFLWAGATSDGRALVVPNTGNRVAGTWYASNSFTIDVNLTDGNTHRLALYALDYDNGGRSERVDVVDSDTGVTLDSRTIGPFTTGQYLVWNLAGHVLINVTKLSGTNAVISGIFFGRSPLVTTPETLSVSTNNLTLAGVAGGANPSPQGVSITNAGIGALNWTATPNQPWLTLSAGSGTAPSTLSIGANLTGLSAGTYTGTVGIGAAGALSSPQAVTVTLNVRAQPAILSLSQTGLTFATAVAGSNPLSQSVTISNAGTGSLGWTATATQPWVTLSAASGTAPSALSIGVSTGGLTAGIFTDTVVISSTGAGNSPASITVTVVVGASSGQHYVSTQGTPNGDGSINNPWDLQTALYQPSSVQPGDTIYVRGGVYGNGTGIFYSRLVGTPLAPIVVKQFPGERAQIDGWLQVGCCDQNPQPSQGGYVWFWGLDFASTVNDRTGLPNGASAILDAVDTWAPGTKFINNIVHDSRVGISMWQEAVGAEAYGNVVYFNGFQATDRGHGHGFYVQNNQGTKNITNNIMFDMFDNGMQYYGTAAAFERNLVVQGNISFNNGAISAGGNMADDVIFVNTNGISSVQLLNNYFYFTPSLGLGYNEMGWPGPNQDILVQGNYFMGGFEAVSFQDWASINFQNNTVYTDKYLINFITASTPSGYAWDNNKYYGAGVFAYNGSSTFLGGWQGWTGFDAHSTSTSGAPTGVWAFVQPNKYESGRANIAVYNWDLTPTVSVDVSTAMTVGTRYQVLDVQNYFGPPVASGTYTGAPITIPMTGLTIAAPNGSVPTLPTHTAPQFGAFVITTLQ